MVARKNSNSKKHTTQRKPDRAQVVEQSTVVRKVVLRSTVVRVGDEKVSDTKKILVYIAKKDTWYDEGSICILIDDYRPQMDAGLFYGMRTCENPASEARPFGDKHLDEEVCQFNKFDVEEFESITS